jgi:hypothetical protein
MIEWRTGEGVMEDVSVCTRCDENVQCEIWAYQSHVAEDSTLGV